jgi:hypothetical protein
MFRASSKGLIAGLGLTLKAPEIAKKSGVCPLQFKV